MPPGDLRPRPRDLRSGGTPVVLLTGLPSSGKTTLALELGRLLSARSTPTQVLDGDVLRARLPPAIGFGAEDRIAQAERALFITELLHDHDIACVLALVMPFAANRRRFAERFGGSFSEVFLDCSVDRLVERDTRGVYAAAVARGDRHYESVLACYERPTDPDLRIDTSETTEESAASMILRAVLARVAA